MAWRPSELEIHVHLTDGTVTRFTQNETTSISHILELLSPGKVFTPHQIVLSDHQSLTMFHTNAIVRIDLIAPGIPDWQFHRNVIEINQADEHAFVEAARSSASTTKTTPLLAGERFVVYNGILLANGDQLFHKVHLSAENLLPIDRAMLFEHMMHQPEVFCRRIGGGGIIVNTAHILRYTIYPGMTDLPGSALPAHRISDP